MTRVHCRRCETSFRYAGTNRHVAFCPTCHYACAIPPARPQPPARAYRDVAPDGMPTGVAALHNAEHDRARLAHRKAEEAYDRGDTDAALQIEQKAGIIS